MNENVSTNYQNFSTSVPGSTTINSLEVHFSTSNHRDEDIQVDYVSVAGRTYQSEDPSTQSQGSWDSATGCDGGFKRSEWIHCVGGWLRYNIGNSSQSTNPQPTVTAAPSTPNSSSVTSSNTNNNAGASAPAVQPVSGSNSCSGFDLTPLINSYNPPSMRRSVSRTFNSLSALQQAINSKTDHGGDVYHLAAGRYSFPRTAIDIINKRNLTVYSDPSNRAVLVGESGSVFGVSVKETSPGSNHNIEVIGFDISNTRFHGIIVGSDSDGTRAGSNIYIGGNRIHNAANVAGAGITVRNASGSGQVVLEGNDVSRIDMDGSGSGRGEGIYIGEGNNNNHYSRNVIIRGNHIHDLNGEAIDIKRASRDVLIEYNQINRIAVFSQGAIVLGLDNRASVNYQANLVVRRNTINDVTSMQYDGNAIVAASDSLIEENLITDIEEEGIDVYNDATGPNKTVTIRRNVIRRTGHQPIRENIGNGNRGPNNPFNIIKSQNCF